MVDFKLFSIDLFSEEYRFIYIFRYHLIEALALNLPTILENSSLLSCTELEVISRGVQKPISLQSDTRCFHHKAPDTHSPAENTSV